MTDSAQKSRPHLIPSAVVAALTVCLPSSTAFFCFFGSLSYLPARATR